MDRVGKHMIPLSKRLQLSH